METAPVETASVEERKPYAAPESRLCPEHEPGSEAPTENMMHPGTTPLPPIKEFVFAADDFEAIRRERQEKLMRLASYAEGRLQEDIRAGMDVDIGKLWQILDAIHAIREGDIR